MARLTDADVTSLVAKLSRAGEPVAPSPQTRTDSERVATGQGRLAKLSSDGVLGQIITQGLAAYLNQPIRCTSGDGSRVAQESFTYTATAGEARYWLRIDSLLASAIADAMIGGEGEAHKIGYGSKVARLVCPAATHVLQAIATAAKTSAPTAATFESAGLREEPFASGSVLIAGQQYTWEAGLNAATLISDVIPSPAEISSNPVPTVLVEKEPVGLEAALDAARGRLEQLARQRISFDEVQMGENGSLSLPHSGIQMSIASRARGAVILAADHEAAAALLNSTLGSELQGDDFGGAVLETGLEVVLADMLEAFAAKLPEAPEDLHHIVRLSEGAILADLPHRTIEHRFQAGANAGTLRWVVPEQMLAR